MHVAACKGRTGLQMFQKALFLNILLDVAHCQSQLKCGGERWFSTPDGFVDISETETNFGNPQNATCRWSKGLLPYKRGLFSNVLFGRGALSKSAQVRRLSPYRTPNGFVNISSIFRWHLVNISSIFRKRRRVLAIRKMLADEEKHYYCIMFMFTLHNIGCVRTSNGFVNIFGTETSFGNQQNACRWTCRWSKGLVPYHVHVHSSQCSCSYLALFRIWPGLRKIKIGSSSKTCLTFITPVRSPSPPEFA